MVVDWWPYRSFWRALVVAVVVLTLTHRHNTMQSVVTGQAPTTLEWKKYLGSKTEAKTENMHTHSTTKDTTIEPCLSPGEYSPKILLGCVSAPGIVFPAGQR